VLVDGLATDLELDVVHQGETNKVGVLDTSTLPGQGDLQVDTVDEVTVAADLAGDTLAEVS
jgi:hypothetical protein